MTAPDRFPANDPRQWLNRARSNLVRSRTSVPDVYLEDLCFDAQQAAEKALKALLIRRGVEIPYIHDIARLTDILDSSGESIPDVVRRAARLTRYAVNTRYPGLDEPVSEAEHAEAVELAEAVVRWAEEQM